MLGGTSQNTLQPCANWLICLRFVTTAGHYTGRRIGRRHENVSTRSGRVTLVTHTSEKQQMQKIALSFAACLMALAATGAHAQNLWKWRDASGQLHITDKAPPAGTPAKNILSAPPGAAPAAAPLLTPLGSGPAPGAAPAPAAATDPAAAASTAGETALDKKKKAADKERADKDKTDRAAVDAKNAAIRKDNCARAQAALPGLQNGARIARINDKGEREVLDDTGRAAEIKRTQDVIASNCGAP